MSRIEEALRLAHGESNANSGESVFAPVNYVSERDQQVSDQAENETGAVAFSHGLRDASLSFSSEWRERLACGPDGNPILVEQFRRLAATLHKAHNVNGLRSVMVTSAWEGDGKTITAVNLAIVLAESYRYSVLLIDADLRRPSIPSVVDFSEGAGLSDALRSSSQQKLALVPLTSRLTLLPAGQPIANSIEALTSPHMQRIVQEATARFDWVVIDAPPVGQTADARLLAEMVGGTLFVIHAARTQHPDVQRAIAGLGREHILGVVLNGVNAEPRDSYYYRPR